MITDREIIPLWLEACPSFRQALAESCTDSGEQLYYVHAGTFADHLLTLHRSQQRSEFLAVAAFIERLHIEGDRYVREFATIGILEGIQNVWGNSGIPPEEFLPFLGPVSATAWQNLNDFWDGKIPLVPDPQNQRQRDGRPL